MATQRSSDAPQNLVEFRWWREKKDPYHLCDEGYLAQVDRKWRKLGRLAAQPDSAALRRGRPVG